ncbi:MAG TPA: 3-hexulose-6-phosphate synthase [Ktedonobacteraceae bacterium]
MTTGLQLAIDTLTPREAVALVERVHPSIDLIEAGTPFIKRFGLGVLDLFRRVAPNKLIVADLKAMDAGAYEASIAFDAGADIMTVLGCASDETILGALHEANRRQRCIAVDLIAVPDKLERARQLENMGVHYICIHAGIDQQALGITPLADLEQIRLAVSTPLVVAGGINVNSIHAVASLGPAVVVVGSYITSASNPEAVCSALHTALDQQHLVCDSWQKLAAQKTISWPQERNVMLKWLGRYVSKIA